MYGHPNVEITSIVKVKRRDFDGGEGWWYRFGGTIGGQRIRDTVEMSAAQVEGMGMQAAQESAKRSLRGLSAYLEEQADA